MHIYDVPLMLVFYILLGPIKKNLALLAVFFNFIQSAVMIAYKLNLLEALFLLGSADYLKVFEPHQLHTLMYLAIKSDVNGFGIDFIFFGFACLVYGYLIFKSGYLPRTLGVVLQIAGMCYLINSFALILDPKFANMLFPVILIPCLVSELSFSLWLIVKGVNVSKWEKQASVGRVSGA